MRLILNANNFDISRLSAIEVDYIPGNIRTSAVLITRENIGILAVEADAEVLTNSSNHVWCPVLLERTNDKGDKIKIERPIVPGEWILVLRGEIYVFPEDVFWGTFCKVPELPSAHQAPETAPEYNSFLPYQPDAGIIESLKDAQRRYGEE
jgi:hypothetical protein